MLKWCKIKTVLLRLPQLTVRLNEAGPWAPPSFSPLMIKCGYLENSCLPSSLSETWFICSQTKFVFRQWLFSNKKKIPTTKFVWPKKNSNQMFFPTKNLSDQKKIPTKKILKKKRIWTKDFSDQHFFLTTILFNQKQISTKRNFWQTKFPSKICFWPKKDSN